MKDEEIKKKNGKDELGIYLSRVEKVKMLEEIKKEMKWRNGKEKSWKKKKVKNGKRREIIELEK